MDFLRELPLAFRKRYLDTHENFLGSIADIIAYLYAEKGDWTITCNKMLLVLLTAGELSKRKDTGDETVHFRNLRNCWYHECALHHPLGDINERMRFAAWKIIQCYYSVFSSIASLVRLKNTQVNGHDKILNFFMTDFVCSNRLRGFFLPPLNFFLNQEGGFSERFSKMVDWKYADVYHIPKIKSCLEYTKDELRKERGDNYCKRRIGIPHYLKILREWTTYQDAYLFFRLYGSSVKENLDRYLKQITFAHCVQTEFFLLKTFGMEAMELQYRTFTSELENNLGIESPPLNDRFRAYFQNSKLF